MSLLSDLKMIHIHIHAKPGLFDLSSHSPPYLGLVRPLDGEHLSEEDGISLSWPILHLAMEVVAERVQWSA